jgi:tyrosyl-tRNA synthetase
MSVFADLGARGLVAQTTDEAAIREMVATDPITVYAGFDPTAASLHVGNLVPLLTLGRMQQAGHRIIAVCGGATALVGDPSGKSSARPMLSPETLARNVAGIRKQLERFLVLDGERGMLLDNSAWIGELGWLEALRLLGPHFSVSRMLSYETYKVRLETGLSYLELSYQLLQAFDFLHLHRTYGCTLQIGGDDQWANILAGMDLIRRVERGSVEGLTVPLLTTATGAKMGKTEQGSLWLDAELTPPYDFYQYWINIDDRDVERCLLFFTHLDPAETKALCAAGGPGIMAAKRRLAHEFTSLVHGREAADRAQQAAKAAFGGGAAGMGHLPTTELDAVELAAGIELLQLLVRTGLCKSRGEARRLLQQGGAYVNGERVAVLDRRVGGDDLRDGAVLLRAGKKRYHRLVPAAE